MALPKYFTLIDTSGSGSSAISVSRASIDSIRTIATTNTRIGVGRIHDRRADHHADGVQVVGRARHQVAGAARLVVAERHLLQPREEVVPDVVLDVARRADDDPAHQEAEDGAHARDAEEQRGVDRELLPRHAAGQIVDRELQHPRRQQLERGREDDADEPEEELRR